VVLLGWLGCKERHLSHYTSLFTSSKLSPRCDVLELATGVPLLSIWIPRLSSALGRRLCELLVTELSSVSRPLLLVCFSGSSKGVWAPALRLMQTEPRFSLLSACLCGEAYDSSPIDFKSSQGVRLFSPDGSSAVRRLAASSAALLLDSLFGGHFERERALYWETLEDNWTPRKSAPVLLLHSAIDPLASSERIEAFAEVLERKGRAVRRKRWPSTYHVAHLQSDPEAYTRELQSWLTASLAVYHCRNSDTGSTRPRSRL
jgi:pimeloyl-ACP methyl ester carboxylesterase